MTEFTLVITEFYTTNADGFAHQLAMCFGLVHMPILPYSYILLSHCMCQRKICVRRKTKPILMLCCSHWNDQAIYYLPKGRVNGPFLKYAVVNSNKPWPPGSNHYILAFWEVACRRFNCVLQNIIQQMISVKLKKTLQLTMS